MVKSARSSDKAEDEVEEVMLGGARATLPGMVILSNDPPPTSPVPPAPDDVPCLALVCVCIDLTAAASIGAISSG